MRLRDLTNKIGRNTMDAPTPFRNKDEDVIKSGALRVTWISGTLAGLAGLVTLFNDHMHTLFGEDLPDEIKAGVLGVVILAWALVAVADVMARAKVTAARHGVSVTPAPQGMKVKLREDDGYDSGWGVHAIRGSEFLIAKQDKNAKWIKQDDATLE
jgi:hypothetical protein